MGLKSTLDMTNRYNENQDIQQALEASLHKQQTKPEEHNDDVPTYYAEYDDLDDNELYPSPLAVAGLIYNSVAKKRNEIMRDYFGSRFGDEGFTLPKSVFKKIDRLVSKLTGPNTDPADEAVFIKALDDSLKDDIEQYNRFERDELGDYADADFAKYYLHNTSKPKESTQNIANAVQGVM